MRAVRRKGMREAKRETARPPFYFKIVDLYGKEEFFYCELKDLSRAIFLGTEVYICGENKSKKIGIINHHSIVFFSLQWIKNIRGEAGLMSCLSPENINIVDQSIRITEEWLNDEESVNLGDVKSLLDSIYRILSGDVGTEAYIGTRAYMILEAVGSLLLILESPEMSHDSRSIARTITLFSLKDKEEDIFIGQGNFILNWLNGAGQLFHM